ncbi:DUF6850 family outer membrane beta-barrel protein [Sphingobacterium sp. LRF_L2]|uniref:DUF6850 family outer membrane beta-barrel protein n=1 Tax=Sphingobacterium sp. LRF_L2 TaxID=3369421 RepID=UPI003F608AFC
MKYLGSLLTIAIVALFFPLKGQEQDSSKLSVVERSQERLSPMLDLQLQRAVNPAIRFYSSNLSYTQMVVELYSSKQDEALIQQQGNEREGFGFSLNSLLAQSENTRAWGSAYYDAGTRRGINWNLSSDYDRIYPYTTTDTLGAGDLKGETYAFAGGYAKELQKYLWGISGSLRNEQEYGRQDPRVRNRISDFEVTLGGAYKLPRYAVGLHAGYNFYKQAQTITELSNTFVRNTTPVISMTGLGTALHLSTNESGYSYEANTTKVGLDLYPRYGKGLLLKIAYEYDKLDKILEGASALHTMQRMEEDRLKTQAGWMDIQDKQKWSVLAGYDYRHRVGSEILVANYDEGNSTGVIPLSNRGMIPYYQENIHQLAVEGLYEWGNQERWYVKPQWTYQSNRTDYRDPARFLEWKHLNYTLQAGVSRVIRKHLLFFNLCGQYTQAVAADMDISNTLSNLSGTSIALYTALDRLNAEVEQANYRFLANDNYSIKADFRWEWQLFANKSLFVQPSYQRGWYVDQVKTQYYQVKLGLAL